MFLGFTCFVKDDKALVPADIGVILWCLLAGWSGYAKARHHRQAAYSLRCALMSIEQDPGNVEAMMQAQMDAARPMGKLEGWLWDTGYAHGWVFTLMRWLMPHDVIMSRVAVHGHKLHAEAMTKLDKMEGFGADTTWLRFRANKGRDMAVEALRKSGGV